MSRPVSRQICRRRQKLFFCLQNVFAKAWQDCEACEQASKRRDDLLKGLCKQHHGPCMKQSLKDGSCTCECHDWKPADVRKYWSDHLPPLPQQKYMRAVFFQDDKDAKRWCAF